MRTSNQQGSRSALSSPAKRWSGCGGSVHIMGSLLLILALIGAGYLYISYKEKRVASDVPKMVGILQDTARFLNAVSV